MTSEETIENQAKEIATLKADIALSEVWRNEDKLLREGYKADIALLKETLTHGLACMKTAREVHKADVAVIRADHKVEVDRLKLAIVSGFECIEKIGVIHGAEVAALKNDCSKYCQPNGNRPRVETFSAGGGPLIFTL